MKAFKRRHERWPLSRDGETVGVDGEKWRNIDNALIYGLRGMPGGSSLTRFVYEHCG